MLNYEELIKNINILLADDDEDYLLMTDAYLKQKGYNVTKVTDGNSALQQISTGKYQIALLDYYMPGLNGGEVVDKIRETNKEIIIILQTGFSGKNPPVETLKKLGIQNYYDKTEGIDKLHTELISAVKIFNQQNEIKIARYKAEAMGSLMAGIAQKIKTDLMAVSAGNELTNMILKEVNDKIVEENKQKIDSIYVKNKTSLDRIDKALASIIGQVNEGKDYIMTEEDIFDIINLIILNDVNTKSIDYKMNISLKTKSYLSGNINNVIYMICQMLKELMDIEDEDKKITLTLTEDELNWIFQIDTTRLNKLNSNQIYIFKNVVMSLNCNFEFEKEINRISVTMNKDKKNL